MNGLHFYMYQIEQTMGVNKWLMLNYDFYTAIHETISLFAKKELKLVLECYLQICLQIIYIYLIYMYKQEYGIK